MEVFKRNAFAKMSLCVVLLVSGCSMGALKRDKKPNNITYSENLQEKFEEIDLNSDGTLDREEIKKYESDETPKADHETPMWALFLILMLMGLLFVAPYVCIRIARFINELRNKKRV
jgi:hypothetical protein